MLFEPVTNLLTYRHSWRHEAS